MKKILAIAVMAAAVLTSCVKNEIVSPAGEINFNAVNLKNTKAGFYGPIADATYPTDEHFGVFAFHSANGFADTYMNNVEVSKYGSEAYWRHATDTYYWPKDATLKFACYSPYADVNTIATATAANGVMFTGFEAPTDVTKQIDLMVSEVSGELDATAGGDGTVNVTFHHLLSQIRFTVRTDKNYGVYDKVDNFKINSVTFTPWGKADYIADGTIAGGYWDNHSTAVTYDALGGTPYFVTKDGSKQNLGTALLIIPQTAGEITVNYTIDYDGTNKVTTDYKFTPVAGWERNKINIYNITIGLNEIKFAPEVQTWDTPAIEEDELIK